MDSSSCCMSMKKSPENTTSKNEFDFTGGDKMDGHIKMLHNDSNVADQHRALFTLRNIICPRSIDAIAKAMISDNSDLVRHECAYCLGQMKDPYAIPYLIETIKDETQHPMVRHEAGEALGAIGEPTPEIIGILQNYSDHHVRELKETCQLALDRLKWYDESNKDKHPESRSPYNTVDPTPSYPDSFCLSELKTIYLDESRCLFDRYRALFTLRNIGTPEAVDVICEGLFGSSSDSALFKHEVAFVLGQLQSPVSMEALKKKLRDTTENEIVRHECAEALGSLGERDILKIYDSDPSPIVAQSCMVALDMIDHEEDVEYQFDVPTCQVPSLC